METMQVRIGNQPVVLASRTVSSSDKYVYEGVELLTDDPEKLIPFVDQLLFFLRVQRYKTHPVRIWESKGVLEIVWSGRSLKAFRDRLLACVSNGEHVDYFQVGAI